MKILATYLKPYWKATLLAPILMIIEVATNLIQPLLMVEIVDEGIKSGNVTYIIRLGVIMVGIALFGIIGGLGNVYFSSIVAQNYGTDLRTDLFKKVQSFSFENLDKFKTASLITRLTNDVMQIQNIVLAMLRVLVRAPLLGIGSIVMALTLNPGLASILLMTIPILALSILFVIKKGIPIFTKVQKKLDRVNTVMRENLTGIRVVKAFVRSDYEKQRFCEANNDLRDITMKASRIVGITMPVMMVVMNFSIVAIIWFGGIKANYGDMQVGQIMAFINYMMQVLFSLIMLSFMLMMVSRAKASTDRIIEVLKTKTDIHDTLEASDEPIKNGHVDFKEVFFRYPNAGGEPVLKNITFRAISGETVAIIGATGSGKSSLVNLIPRFYDVTEGKVLIDGKDIRNIKLNTLRNCVSMVLQESILFSGTIMENLRWGRDDAKDEEVIEAAKKADAHDFITHFPDGYNTVVGQRGVNLSGGQKQRLAIARALLKNPVILIMDDSTSAIDMGTEARIQSALKVLLKKPTCFIIAQRISTVLEADKIIVLEDGEIINIGNHSELLQKCSIYQDIYYSQMGKEVVWHD